MKKLFFLILYFAVAANPLWGQHIVSGKVVDGSTGEPLIGANILIKGMGTGTVTDIDGNYSVEVPTNATLVISYIGYTSQELAVGNRTSLNIQLAPDVTALSEIVVVGYGVQRRTDVTGATATVRGSELQQQPVLTPTQAMQGKVAGVQIISSGQPGVSPQIRIRGVSSALGGTTALYVVDGVLTDDISNINTADIVDISILKDASAAAIYGSRGANGVVIITTRKGRAGEFLVNYNNSLGIRQATNLVEMANAEEYRNYVQAATGAIPPASDFDTDWYDEILRVGFHQIHNMSISGGSERANYMLNFGYLSEEGIVILNDFERLTIRFNNEFHLTDRLTFGLQSSYGNSVNQNGFGNLNIDAFGNIGSVYNDAYRASPIIASVVDGRYGNTSAYQNVGNPVLGLNNNDIRVRENRFQGSANLSFNPIDWLTIRTSFGGDWRNSLNRGYYYRFLADENTFLIAGGNQARQRSNLAVQQTQGFRWVWDNTATIVRHFGHHELTFLVGTTAEEFNLHWFSSNRSDVPADPNLWYIGVGDANTSQNNGGGDAWARNSYLARLNYGYDGRYLLTATIRSDGSSRLPLHNRWQQYPSFGVGWVLSREGFMRDQNMFDLLKLRASYGKVGNDQIPTNAFIQTVELNKAYPFSGSASAATNGAQINQIIDPDIRWEITEEYNLALEMAMFASRLTGEINFYNKRVENALINIPIPRTVGDADGIITTNAASIENTGVEVVLGWSNEVNENFSYNISGNATFNRNRVIALNGGQAIWGGSIGAAQGFTTYTDNDQPIGSFYVLKVLGVFNTQDEINTYVNENGQMIQPNARPGMFKYWDRNGDGIINDLDRVFAGSYQPKAYFGMNLGINYRNWDMSLSLYGNAGNQVYNGKKAVRVEGRDNVERAVVYSRWTSANQTQAEPAANTGNLPASDYFVESGTFGRINNLTIGYNLPGQLLDRLRVNSIRFFATSQNLLTIQRYSGFTAELPGDPTSSGIELSAYPKTRTIAAGVNIGF